jgi:hypothetical protein
MRSVRQGLTTTTYAKGSAQYHWGVTPPGRWVLFDIHKDPGCRNDLSKANPELVAEMIAAYDRWWMDTYPVMIERGGDEGDAGAIDRQRAAFFKRAAGVEAERRAVVKPAADTAGRQSNVFIRMDADGDNRVTREEYLGLFVPTFPDKDTDRDGKLAPEEFPYEGSFKVGDADADGYLTPAEFEGMYSHQFESRDRNRDGFVTVDEM